MQNNAGTYVTKMVETYLVQHYPDWHLSFINAGWSGDNAEGGKYRLDRDVLALKPNVVTICFGMNDAYYMKPEASIGDLYATNLSSLIKRLKAAGIRVAVLTPGVVDEEGEKNKWMKDIDYNRGGLDMVRGRTLKVAGQEGVPAQDLHSLFTKVLAAAKRADKNFQFAPDGIHPDEGGGLVMAYALLKALGVPNRTQSLRVDLKTGVVSSDGAKGTTRTAGSFSIQMQGLPYFVPEKARKILPFLDWQKDLNHVELKVSGAEGPTALEIGGAPTAFLDPKVLESGLALEELWDSDPMRHAEELGVFCIEKNKAYIQLWRNLALKPNYNQWETSYRPVIHQMAIADNVKLQQILRGMARRAQSFELRVFPLPKQGEALANGDWIHTYALSPRMKEGAKIDSSAATVDQLIKSTGVWIPRRVDVAEAGMNLDFLLASGGKGTAYAAVRLESPLAQRAKLKIAADDSFEAFVNGKSVGKSKMPGGLKPDSDQLSVDLKKGSNLLLIRVVQMAGSAGLAARFDGLQEPLRSWPAGL